jgi:hypothetical protein
MKPYCKSGNTRLCQRLRYEGRFIGTGETREAKKEKMFSAVSHRFDLESLEKMNWQLSKQHCITAALMAVMISLSTAQLTVAQEQLVVPERT